MKTEDLPHSSRLLSTTFEKEAARIEALPAWARQLLRSLHRRLLEVEETITEINGENSIDPTRATVSVTDGLDTAVLCVNADVTVKYQLYPDKPSERSTVHINVVNDLDCRSLRVYGHSRIAVYPMASNAVEIRPV